MLRFLPIYLGENVLKHIVSLQRQPANRKQGDYNHKHLDDLPTKNKSSESPRHTTYKFSLA